MDGYHISTNKEMLDKKKIWSMLRECFWSKNIPIEYVEKFINYSLCFGLYTNFNELVGFGRVITDYTTYAYVCDIIIDHKHRNKGLGNVLVSTILSHPELQGLKTWSLKTTEEARGLYKKNGFKVVEHPETQLEINDLEIYSRPSYINLNSNVQSAGEYEVLSMFSSGSLR